MRFVRNQAPHCPWLRVIALAMISAFLVTIAVSEAPRLHEQIHKVQGAEHNCAVTILSTGGIEFCGNAVVVGAPHQLAERYSFRMEANQCSLSQLDFLLLEHAPPALS